MHTSQSHLSFTPPTHASHSHLAFTPLIPPVLIYPGAGRPAAQNETSRPSGRQPLSPFTPRIHTSYPTCFDLPRRWAACRSKRNCPAVREATALASSTALCFSSTRRSTFSSWRSAETCTTRRSSRDPTRSTCRSRFTPSWWTSFTRASTSASIITIISIMCWVYPVYVSTLAGKNRCSCVRLSLSATSHVSIEYTTPAVAKLCVYLHLPLFFLFFLISYNSHHNIRAQSRETMPVPRR